LKLRITIDGTTYEADVEVVDEEEKIEEDEAQVFEEPIDAAEESGAGGDANPNECRSPVMGLVIRVDVGAGQQVGVGQQVMVLEAMKMETRLTAPRACKVKCVHVAAGDPVKVDQLLIEFE